LITKLKTILFIAVCCSIVTISDASAQSPALNKLIDTLEQGNVLYTRFEHHTIDSFTGDTTANSGELWLTTNSYKVKTSTSLLLVDGDISKVYDKIKERLIISTYNPDEDDFAPSQLLREVQTEYNSIEQQRNGNSVTVTMSSDDLYATFKQVNIELNNNIVPQSIEAVDQADNRIRTHFSASKFVEISSEMFTLDYTAETKIIDLRQ